MYASYQSVLIHSAPFSKEATFPWKANVPPLWNILNKTADCGCQLVAPGKRQKRQLGLLKRILKQFKRSCICIYSPCDSDVWQLQSDQYMACFRSIKTKRRVCLGAFCFFTWQPSGGASYWCGTREAALFLNLKIKFFCLKVGCWVEVVSTSLSGFRNETGVFIDLQNTTAETHEKLTSCITGYTERNPQMFIVFGLGFFVLF